MWEKAKRAYRVRHQMFGGDFIRDIWSREGRRRIRLFNYSTIWFQSAEAKMGGRGGGDLIRYVIGDEAAYWDESYWKDLTPALGDNLAEACLISTPNKFQPRNWFYEQWLLGQVHVEETCLSCGGMGCEGCQDGVVHVSNPLYGPEYQSWRFSTYDNPHYPPQEIERWIRDQKWTHSDILREVYGYFVSSEGAIFKLEDIHALFHGELQDPDPGHRYVMGLDFGKAEDYTVVVVIDGDTQHVVHFDRFQGSWGLQSERIMSIYQRYHSPYTIMDATNIGSVTRDILLDKGLSNSLGLVFNGPTKTALIDALRVAVENGAFTCPYWQEMETELANFEARLLPSGRASYRAAKGYHDDIVDSLALAWRAFQDVGGGLGNGLQFYVLGE